MPLSDEIRGSVSRYRQDVRHAVPRLRTLRADVEDLTRRLAPGGPLGDTADPDLTRARQLLAVALARLDTAITATTASGEPGDRYVARAFPE